MPSRFEPIGTGNLNPSTLPSSMQPSSTLPSSRDPSARPPLLDLPVNLLSQIASQLDRSTSINLARTCTRLQPFGESAAWQELNISVHRLFQSLPQSDTRIRPLGAKRLHAIRHSFIWGPTEEWEEVYDRAPDALQSYYEALIAVLQVRPAWCKAVRTIYIDIDRLLDPRAADLLKLTAPTLTDLQLIPPGFPYDPVPRMTILHIHQLFRLLGSHRLDRLRRLRLPLDGEWDTTIVTALPCTPHLQSLRLSVTEPFSGSWGETMTFGKTDIPENDWPPLPLLEHLEIDEIHQAFVPMLVALVRSAPRLTTVNLGDPSRSWFPEAGNELVKLLADSISMKHLSCSRQVLPVDLKGKFCSVETASIVEHRQPWGLSQLETVFIPALRSMKIFYSYAQFYESRSVTWGLAGETRGLPAPIRPLTYPTLQSLKAAPSLLLVQLPSGQDKEWTLDPTEEGWSYWGSDTCAANHDRGVLIRSYAHESGAQFFHCRSFSAHHSHIDEGTIHRTENVWEEHTDYEGFAVPANILGAVYHEMGADAGWKVPKRDARMPEVAWDILRKWKLQEESEAQWGWGMLEVLPST